MKNEEEIFWEKLNARRMGREQEQKRRIQAAKKEPIRQVYFISDGEYIKIGWTTGTVKERLSELQVGNARPLKVIGCIYTDLASRERAIHFRFRDQRIRGEWFKITPELLAYINRHKSEL